MALDVVQLLGADLAGGAGRYGLEHAVQVQILSVASLAHSHRAAGAEDGRDVAAQRAHHHAGDDFVTIRDADAGIESMGGEHCLYAVGNQFTAREGELHASVGHCYPITHADEIELDGGTACAAHFFFDELCHLVQVNMPRNHFIERVADRYEGLVYIFIAHARRPHEAAVRGTFDAGFGSV